MKIEIELEMEIEMVMKNQLGAVRPYENESGDGGGGRFFISRLCIIFDHHDLNHDDVSYDEHEDDDGDHL